jgi:putative tryptophan/tyrosine transport system substrate-binding protein
MSKKNILTIVAVFVLLAAGASIFLLSNKNTPIKQPAQKVYKVGILNGFDYVGANVDGFKAGMTELGYIEGKNIVYDVQKTDPDLEKYKAALKKFADEKVDLMFTFPTEASLEAKKIDKETGIPLVFSHVNF